MPSALPKVSTYEDTCIPGEKPSKYAPYVVQEPDCLYAVQVPRRYPSVQKSKKK